MDLKQLEGLSLGELREKFPEIKSTSKVGFIEKLKALWSIDVHNEEFVAPENEDEDVNEASLADEIIRMKDLSKRYLIISNTSLESTKIMSELFLELDYRARRERFNIMYRAKMNEIHVNGNLYIKFSCAKNAEHWLRKQKWTDVIKMM